MFYRVLGFVVGQVGKWYLRRRAGALLPSRRAAAAGLVGLAVVALAVQGARREGSS
jgi:hypothetical protein